MAASSAALRPHSLPRRSSHLAVTGAQYEGMTRDRLRILLGQRHQTQSGLKADLVDRLVRLDMAVMRLH